MAHVCPWWFCYTFDNPLRRLVHDPVTMLAPWLRSGATCLDLGCGMGYFTIGLARLAAPDGRVVAVDLQEKMLERVKRRAAKAGLASLVETRRCAADSLGIADLVGAVDFALCFWMLHEVPDMAGFLGQVLAAQKSSGRLLVAEPRFHVSVQAFDQELALAQAQGWRVVERPAIWGSHAALLAPATQAAQSAAA